MMKKIKFLLLSTFILISFSAFAQEGKSGEKGGDSRTYTSVGEDFTSTRILSAGQVQEKYQQLKPGDTLNISFKSTVASVCEKKGCWMKVALDGEQEVMVKFKDYSFFVPKDIQEKEVILNGKAYVTELSVEDQKHYAEDAGKSTEEINAIKKPEKTLSFLADGVKIKN